MTQHSKQDTSWRVPATTLFLIVFWVMTASLGVLNTLHYTSPHREIQTTTVQNHKQQPKLQIKSVNRFSISQRLPQNNWR